MEESYKLFGKEFSTFGRLVFEEHPFLEFDLPNKLYKYVPNDDRIALADNAIRKLLFSSDNGYSYGIQYEYNYKDLAEAANGNLFEAQPMLWLFDHAIPYKQRLDKPMLANLSMIGLYDRLRIAAYELFGLSGVLKQYVITIVKFALSNIDFGSYCNVYGIDISNKSQKLKYPHNKIVYAYQNIVTKYCIFNDNDYVFMRGIGIKESVVLAWLGFKLFNYITEAIIAISMPYSPVDYTRKEISEIDIIKAGQLKNEFMQADEV